MEHQVRVIDGVVAAGEPAAFEVVRRAWAASQEQPLQGDLRPVAPQKTRRDRYRLSAAMLDVDLEVVLEVLAHSGEMFNGVNAECRQFIGVADARELQQGR